ncbi:transposase is4 [Holotrichia oblita]|uniref:Transposase is4 n=1 Tax=Holotrichia oblita TaxID=644536 RepID=A0ACB9SK99_HOLOL|nr:transposase is4 [Holotrichia oblita]
MSAFGKLTIDELLACLENSNIERYEDDETNSDSENENFENNENFVEGLGEQFEKEESADSSSDSDPEFNIPLINLKARCGRNSWKIIPIYMEDSDVENICACTNLKYLLEHDKPMNLTTDEVRKFLGISILMSCLKFSQIRMYWAASTRVERIVTSMARNRFFSIKGHLKVVVDNDIPEDTKKKRIDCGRSHRLQTKFEMVDYL